MAYLRFDRPAGGYRVHNDDGSVEPEVYVSYHQAAAHVRMLNLVGPPATETRPAPRRRRRMLMRRNG